MSKFNKVNTALTKLTRNTYFPHIPVNEINQILTSAGFNQLEDGIYTGAEGSLVEKIGDKAHCMMTWYKMPSGRYEIVIYVN
jgi:hypothetical protein